MLRQALTKSWRGLRKVLRIVVRRTRRRKKWRWSELSPGRWARGRPGPRCFVNAVLNRVFRNAVSESLVRSRTFLSEKLWQEDGGRFTQALLSSCHNLSDTLFAAPPRWVIRGGSTAGFRMTRVPRGFSDGTARGCPQPQQVPQSGACEQTCGRREEGGAAAGDSRAPLRWRFLRAVPNGIVPFWSLSLELLLNFEL